MFNIRPFQKNDAEYDAIAAVEKAVFPDNPETVEDFKYSDQTRNPNLMYHRLVVVHDGQIVGFAIYAQQSVSGRYHFYITVHPDFERRGVGTAVYNHILNAITPLTPAPEMLGTGCYEHKPQSIQFLQKREFKQVMRWVISTLDVATFDDTPFASLAAKIADQGIDIMPLSTLKTIDPTWQNQLYELDWLLTLDEPQPYLPKKPEFAQYVKREIENPNLLHDAWFVARENGRYVGMTQLTKSDDLTTYKTGFTGTVRSHRRRGLATLLKTNAIHYAKQSGIRTIRTGNEENNPMYALNLKLGFKDLTANLAFEKVIDGR
ncbi:MAG: GNAT family N-acetyltransferase [Chloroflexi bacterium]|nr:MAG: GNAT family N-acetyltransferase [Chloroflexota bacterium]